VPKDTTTDDGTTAENDKAGLDRLAAIMGVRWPGATWESIEEPDGRYVVIGPPDGPQIVIEPGDDGVGWQARESDANFPLASGATLALTALGCACEIGYQFLIGAV